MSSLPSSPRSRFSAAHPIPLPDRDEWPRLPVPLSSLVGRKAEVAAVAALLRDPGVRLVTLTGPGGVGKTRLALRLAAELAAEPAFADGVAFVELATVRDADLVLPTIVQALGLRHGGREPAGMAQATFLRSRRVLLVLDNFEQVVAAGPRLTDLLVACPDLRVLVTSRARLCLSGEHAVAVPPLSLPGPEASAGEADAVRLFLQRVRAVRGDFALTADTIAAVEEICRRLDGLPPAIELAAARCAIFTPSALLARLERRLPQLAAGPRDAPVRHRTMRGAIAWSYDLLEPKERAVFRGLAVFVGGCTLEAAEAVCGPQASGVRRQGSGENPPSVPCPLTPDPSVFEIIESLARQSLLRVAEPAGDDTGSPHLVLLETVREFAAEQLVANVDADRAVRRRHAAYFLALAAQAEPTYWADAAGDWKAELERELGNLRAALEWATAQGEADTVLRLASTMFDPPWLTGDNAHEQMRWSRQALALPGGTPANRVKALTSAAWLANAYFDFGEGCALAEEAMAIAGRHGDAVGLAWAAFVRGHAAFHAGDLAGARQHLTRALTAFRALNRPGRLAWTLCYLASLDSCDAIDEGGDPAALAHAVALYEEALAIFREVGHLRGTARALHGLAYVAYKQRDLPRALSSTREVLALDWAHGWPVYHYLEDIADIAGRTGRPEVAARLYGAAQEQRERVGRPVEPVYRAEFERDVAVARCALGADAFAAAWVAGAALTPERAVAEALDPALPAAAAGPAGPAGRLPLSEAPLTARQAEILPLLAAGKTDREIAAALFLSPRTVEHHVARLAARLGVRSRAAVVGAAHAAGLLAPPPRQPATGGPSPRPTPVPAPGMRSDDGIG